MSRYIDADEFVKDNLKALDNAIKERVVQGEVPEKVHLYELAVKDVLKNIAHAPTADVVEVVRCKDCDNWERTGKSDNRGVGFGSCAEWSDAEDGMTRYTKETDFCSYGERKE